MMPSGVHGTGSPLSQVTIEAEEPSSQSLYFTATRSPMSTTTAAVTARRGRRTASAPKYQFVVSSARKAGT